MDSPGSGGWRCGLDVEGGAQGDWALSVLLKAAELDKGKQEGTQEEGPEAWLGHQPQQVCPLAPGKDSCQVYPLIIPAFHLLRPLSPGFLLETPTP